MSPLAVAVYEILRLRVGRPEPRISYCELGARLRDRSTEFDHIFHRSPELYAALREVGRECRRLHLPPLPALVVRADTRRPGDAYYSGKGSGYIARANQIAAWRRDLESVKRSTYPPR